MSSRGWIKLHRRIQDHWIYQEERTFSRYESWLDLIMLANHKDNKTLIDGELITVERGSFVTSKRKLGSRWKWSNTKVDSFLKLLEQDRMIEQKSDTKKTVITIVKYEVYHELEKEKRHENETETKRKRNGNDTKTNKQELKNLRTKEFKRTTTTVENGFGELLQLFEENLCKLSTMQIDSFGMWYDDFDQNDEIIIESIKIAADRNRKNFGFVELLLREWSNNKLETIDQVQTYERNKFNSRQSNFKQNKPTEIVPDWFKDRNKEPENNQITEQDPKQSQKEKAEIDALIKQYAES